MSDLFGNHIVGFPTRWLILYDCNTWWWRTERYAHQIHDPSRLRRVQHFLLLLLLFLLLFELFLPRLLLPFLETDVEVFTDHLINLGFDCLHDLWVHDLLDDSLHAIVQHTRSEDFNK